MPNVTEASLDRYTTRPMPQVEGVEHCFIEAGGVDIHVAVAGEGAPVLLIHGYPQHWFLWRRLIPALARERRVISPDLRGFGWSEAPAEGYDKETLTRDVLAVMDRLGIERVPVVGHDWGGWIGMLMGILAPQRLERVVVMSVSHPFFKRSLRNLVDSWHIWHGFTLGTPWLGPRASRPSTRSGRATARWLGSGSWSDEERHVFLDQFEEPERAWAAHRLYWLNGTTDFQKVMRGRYRERGLRAPALVLLGTRDKARLPWRAEDYEPYAPNMTVEPVEGAGHALVEDEPALVLRRIRSFLAETP
jgi:pimeloyl-ACP methyl ester carboxylesterase